MTGAALGKRLLIVGATGGTGRHLVEQGIARGHAVSVIVRDPAKLTPDSRLTTFTGDVLSPATLEAAVAGQEAVICALGSGATGPFGRMSMLSEGTKNLLTAMRRAGVERLICITGVGAGESKGHGPWYYNLLIQPLLLRGVYEDKTRQEREIRRSDLEWTIVRPSILTDEATADGLAVKVFTRMQGVRARTIARSAVARFCLDELETGAYRLQAPVVTTR